MKRANALTHEEIGVLQVSVLRNNMPRALLNMAWMTNCTNFGMRPGQQQQDLCWGDLELKTNADGLHYVAFRVFRQAYSASFI